MSTSCVARIDEEDTPIGSDDRVFKSQIAMPPVYRMLPVHFSEVHKDVVHIDADLSRYNLHVMAIGEQIEGPSAEILAVNALKSLKHQIDVVALLARDVFHLDDVGSHKTGQGSPVVVFFVPLMLVLRITALLIHLPNVAANQDLARHRIDLLFCQVESI